MMSQAIDFLSRPEFLAVGLGLAAFLVLTWVVRGAPIGQAAASEPAAAPSPGRRDVLVALAVLGPLLIAGGAVAAFRLGIPWSLPLFAAGIGLTLWVQRASRPHRHVSPTLRRVVAFSEAALTTALVGGILLVVDVAAFKYGGRPLDFTRDEAFTLSSLSLNQVRSLPRPLRLTLVMGQDRRSVRHRARIRQLARLYQEANPSAVRVEEINPYLQSHAAAFEALARRAPDVGVVPGDALVLEYGADDGPVDRSVIAVADLSRGVPGPDGGAIATTFTGEDAITSAIVRAREGKRTPVGFTTSHGEPSIGEMDPRLPGLGLWKARLTSLGLDPVELNLVRDDVPPAVGLVVVVGPKTRFQDEELARLKAFRARGGSMLFAMNKADVGLDPTLADYNVALDPGVVVDSRLNLGYRASDVYTPPLVKSDHPLVSALAGQGFVVPEASPLRIIGASPPKPGEPRPEVNPAMIDYPFLRTGNTSWAETNRSGARVQFDRGSDAPGPLTVGIAVAERAEVAGESRPRPRLVVLSSRLMATNPFFPFNADLLMNAVHWLRGKSEDAGIAPRVQAPIVFAADPNLRVRLHLVPTVLMAVLIVGLGATTYLARRS